MKLFVRKILPVTLGAALALCLAPRDAAAQDEDRENARRDRERESVAMEANRGLQLGLGPVFLLPTDGGPAGGGLDLEGRYGLRAGPVVIGPGGKAAGYLFSGRTAMLAMPTVRVTLPVGPLAPFVVGGLGGGALGNPSEGGVALMGGGGLHVHLGKVLALGAEVTYQRVTGTELEVVALGPSIRVGL